MNQQAPTPRILVFPFPIQGNLNCMLKLSELLCLSNLHVTFLNSHHNYARLLRFTDIQNRFRRYPGFRFETITDGLPDDHPRSGRLFMELFDAISTVTKPAFDELLTRLVVEERESPVTCLIVDGVIEFALDAAEKVGIKVIFARPISPCYLWTLHCLPQLVEAGELPLQGNGDMDRKMTQVPSMETFLRARDLPSFFRKSEPSDPFVARMISETKQAPRAYGFILNTFEDLEAPLLSHFRSHCPNIYTLGPIHALLESKLPRDSTSFMDSNSLWQEDKSCMSWLDMMPVKSVLYVSFGSIAIFTRDQILEIWHGLVNSEKSFLWVIRPKSIIGEEGSAAGILTELSEATKERGYMVEWAPQKDVLCHPAIGGFMTHSGWNSTLESLVAGVPMICWPYFADQQVNSRYVSHVWKLGLDMKDTCDRVIVEKMVRDLMDVRRDEFLQSAIQMAQLAKKAVSEGGSSYSNLDRLIKDISLTN